MKLIYLFLFSFLLGISCNMSFNGRPYQLLNKYSMLNFNESNASLVEYNENKSGIKEEGIIQAVFKMQNLNIDSLEKQLLNLGYKKLPISELEMGNGFNGNVQKSDTGYYKLALFRTSIIDQLIIVNFTQKKIILYKLI